jgi:hypothetical protein
MGKQGERQNTRERQGLIQLHTRRYAAVVCVILELGVR